MDAGGQSCVVTTANLCSDMKINTCGKTAPDNSRQALMRAILTTTTQYFPFESCSFLAFSLHVWSRRGWTEDEESKGGMDFIGEYISLTANPYCIPDDYRLPLQA